MGDVTAIVVGLGVRGCHWLDLLARSDGAQVVAGVDPDAGARNQARRYLGGPACRLFPALSMALRNCNAQAAIVCTPATVREEPVLACLEAGMGVLVEKPFARSAAEARRMVARAEALGRPLVVAQNYRYALPEAAIRQALADGAIGRVGFCHCVSHRLRPAAGTYLVRVRYAQLDMAVHHFDNFRHQLGADAVSVKATAFNPPWSDYEHGAGISVLITFSNGVGASYLGSYASQNNSFSERIEGSEGLLTCEDTRVRCRRRGRIFAFRPRAPEMHALDRRKLPYGGMHAVLEEMKRALDGDLDTPNCAKRNLQTLGILLACIASDSEGCEVSIAEALNA